MCSLKSAKSFLSQSVGFVDATNFCKKKNFLSQKFLQKFSVTKNLFLYKNTFTSTNPTMWLENDFALFRELISRKKKNFISVHLM